MHEDIKELKADVKMLVQQGAVHNELLRQHEARSLALQDEQKAVRLELEPVKEHVALVGKILKVLGAVFVGAVTQAIVRHFI
jgi:hypothetical protein